MSSFDRIAHDHILAMLSSFPARGMIRQWLKVGVVEQGMLHRTEEGTPQGGVVSPVLLNVALHGMEQAAGVRYCTTGANAGRVAMGSPTVIRYADDFARHEAPWNRMEVKGLHRRSVAAGRGSGGQPDPGDAGEGGKQP